jgi:hypothetical protein
VAPLVEPKLTVLTTRGTIASRGKAPFLSGKDLDARLVFVEDPEAAQERD